MTGGGAPVPPLQRRLLWSLLAAVMLAIAFTAVMAPRWAGSRKVEPPPVLGQAPQFNLTNRNGKTLSDTDLLGSPWVADFIFTRCAISCPRMTQQTQLIQKNLGSIDCSIFTQ